MQRLLALVLSTALLSLAACGSDDGETAGGYDLSAVKVSTDKTPKVELEAGASSSETESKVVTEGSGETVAKGDSVKLNYLAFNGRTGKQFDSSYATGKASTFALSETSVLPGFIKALEGHKVGSRVLAIIPPKDGFDAAREELDLKKDDSMVFVFDIVAKVPNEATGKSQALPSSLPKLQLDDDGRPEKFVKTAKTAAKQTKSSAHVVIAGKGDKVKADQTLTVQYLGQVYPSGKIFDSSWSRNASATFQLTEGQLIECWTDELVGQRVGSRVVLVCPSDTAYGDQGSGEDIKGGDTLLFAIDLLDAS